MRADPGSGGPNRLTRGARPAAGGVAVVLGHRAELVGAVVKEFAVGGPDLVDLGLLRLQDLNHLPAAGSLPDDSLLTRPVWPHKTPPLPSVAVRPQWRGWYSIGGGG